MPNENVEFGDKHAEFIKKPIESGGYRNTSEVVRIALSLLEAQDDDYRGQSEMLRVALKEGMDAYEQGRCRTLGSREDIQALGRDITRRGRAQLATEADVSTNPTH